MTDQPDLFSGSPAYHEGRKPYVEPVRGTFASKLPEFERGDRIISFEAPHGSPSEYAVCFTCPRCKEEMYLPEESPWLRAHGEARPCPFCWRSSRVP